MGILKYVAYAVPSGQYASLAILGVAIAQFLLLPVFAVTLNAIDTSIYSRWRLHLPAKAARLGFHTAINFLIFAAIYAGVLLPEGPCGTLVLSAPALAFFAAAASQGFQFLAIRLARKGIGSRDTNVLLSLSLTIVGAALAAFSLTHAQTAIAAAGFAIAIPFIAMWIMDDLRTLCGKQDD